MACKTILLFRKAALYFTSLDEQRDQVGQCVRLQMYKSLCKDTIQTRLSLHSGSHLVPLNLDTNQLPHVMSELPRVSFPCSKTQHVPCLVDQQPVVQLRGLFTASHLGKARHLGCWASHLPAELETCPNHPKSP